MTIPQYTLLSALVLLSGCGLFNSDENEPPVPFERVFTAEINGEPYDVSNMPSSRASSGITMMGDYPYLLIFADQFSEEFYPYNESIIISMFYEEGRTTYPSRSHTVQIDEVNVITTGGRYFEAGGDALISTYRTPEDDDGYITVEMEELGDGRTTVFGTFEMKVIVDSRADPHSHRVGQDTLYITNGEYRVLLLQDQRDQ